jgi:hypothetical protein
MKWHRPLSEYQPLTQTWIYCFKAILTALLLLYLVIFLNPPTGSTLVCAAPLCMMAPDRSLIRDVYWQMPLGFCLGVFFGLIAINFVGVYWPVAITLMCLWNAFWVYISESSPVLRIPCRITSIVPVSLLSIGGKWRREHGPRSDGYAFKPFFYWHLGIYFD